MKHNRLAPDRMTVRVELHQLHIAGIPISSRPCHHNAAIARASDLRSEMRTAVAGKLHAIRSPHRIASLVHLGCGDLLIRAFARIEKRQQRVPLRIDIESVVLGGTVAQLRDLSAIVRELFYASSVEPLQEHAVANWRRTV